MSSTSRGMYWRESRGQPPGRQCPKGKGIYLSSHCTVPTPSTDQTQWALSACLLTDSAILGHSHFTDEASEAKRSSLLEVTQAVWDPTPWTLNPMIRLPQSEHVWVLALVLALTCLWTSGSCFTSDLLPQFPHL